jgi:Fe2+ transport system protein FeoA
MAEIELDAPADPRPRRQPVTPPDDRSGASGDPLVQPLARLAAGDRARIVHLGPVEPDLLVRLSNLGFVPGTTVRLHQKRPATVVSIGATTLALDREIARRIFVRRVEG